MQALELSYNLNQVVKQTGDQTTVSYVITNDDNETLVTFDEADYDQAHRTWWSWLNADERAAWEDYEMECEVAAEMDEQDRWERMIGA